MIIRIFLAMAIAICAQSVQAGLVAQTAPAHESLQEVVAQGQTKSDASLATVVNDAKPSTVALDIGTDPQTGIRFYMTGDFTPAEIDRYPQYEHAFANHAANELESDNPADIAAIKHLVDKYPDLASYLDETGRIQRFNMNNEVRKHLNKATKKPIMNGNIAEQIVLSSPSNAAVSTLLGGSLSSLRTLASELNEDNANAWGNLGNNIINKGKSFPGDAVRAIPRTIAVGVGTTALTNLVLREFDERVGDPLPCSKSKYDKCVKLKRLLRTMALPIAISFFITGPLYDKASQAIQGE